MADMLAQLLESILSGGQAQPAQPIDQQQNVLEASGLNFGGARNPQGEHRIKLTEPGWTPETPPPFLDYPAAVEGNPLGMTVGQSLEGSPSTGYESSYSAEDVTGMFDRTKEYERESTEGLADLGPRDRAAR